MSLLLSDVIKQTKRISVALSDGQELEIEFKTNFYTPKVRNEMIASEFSVEQQAALIVDTLTWWGFVDKKGEMVSITEENLNKLSIHIHNAIFGAMMDAVSPNVMTPDQTQNLTGK